jgi:hypothetical protein
MSTKELLNELISDGTLLAKRQIKLARLEAKEQLARERTTAELLGVGGALAYAALILLLVTTGLAIGAAIGPLWLGTLIVGGVLLIAAAIAGAIGWSARVRQPLSRSRKELEREITWAKHELTT